MTQAGRKVGIDAMQSYIPKLHLPIERLAEARGIQVSHLHDNIGVDQMAIPDNHEDAATMAANAAAKLMRAEGLTPREIGRIYVGTESQGDKSKPVASKVVGMLEMIYGEHTLQHVDAVDNVFACIGGTYALQNTTDWILAGSNRGKAGIVIATDVAQYDLGSRGEPTQGAGAVAMLVTDGPRFLVFENEAIGTCTRDERDFFKPYGRKHPVVDSDYSIGLYLDTMRHAFYEFVPQLTALLASRGVPLRNGEVLSDRIILRDYHLPFTGMGKRIDPYLMMHEWAGTPRWAAIEQEVGRLPPNGHHTVTQLMSKEYKERAKLFSSAPTYKKDYFTKVHPLTAVGRKIGNTYTASWEISLQGGFESALGWPNIANEMIGVGSYGSGSCAKAFALTVQDGYHRQVGKMDLLQQLARRTPIDFATYTVLHESEFRPGTSVLAPKNEFGIERIGQEEKDIESPYYRLY